MAAIDLCTLDDVRNFLQKQTSDAGQDDTISELITRASRLILRYTEREFTPITASATRSFEWEGGGWLSLAPYDCTVVNSVARVLMDGSTVALSAVQWRAWPVPNPDGVYTALRIYGTVPQSVGIKPTVMQVTGAWGWPSVPSEVRAACVETVTTWMRRDVAAFSTTYTIDEGRLERPEVIPSAAARKLDMFRRAMQ